MNDQRSLQEQVQALTAQNAALAEQVKLLVRADRRLFLSQRELDRQLARVEALSHFAGDVAGPAAPAQILDRALELLFGVLATDQAMALVSDGFHRLVPLVQRAVPGREFDSVAAMAQLGADGWLDGADVPTEPVFHTPEHPAPDGPMMAACASLMSKVYGDAPPATHVVLVPVGRPAEPPLALLILRRVQGLATFHETPPVSGDAAFLQVLSQQVAGALVSSQVAARERLATLGEVAAVIAHEVRNPLGVIFNSLDALGRLVGATGDAGFMLRVAREEAERLNQIVGDLLDYANPRPPNFKPETLMPVLESAVGSAASDRAEARGAITLEPGDDVPLVSADARMLRQVFLNLITNAAQAAGATGKVVVRAGRETVEGRLRARVDITDSGPGIPEHLLGRLFEPFYTTRATGTGLGLAVVKRFVDAHGGEVKVTSRAGVGSTFSVSLPVALSQRAP